MVLLVGAIVAALVASYPRGGYMGIGFGALAMVAALGRRALPALGALAAGGVVVAGLAVGGALPGPVLDRLTSITAQLQIYDVRGVEATPETFAQLERLAHWQAAGNMFLSNPWLGVGIGNFNVVYPKFAVAEWPYSRGHAHNYYLHALAETGLAGLAAYGAVLATALVAAGRALRHARRAGTGADLALVIGALGVVVTIMGHSVFENLHVLNMGIHWAAVIALLYLVRKTL
jgi:O-antigen ligase